MRVLCRAARSSWGQSPSWYLRRPTLVTIPLSGSLPRTLLILLASGCRVSSSSSQILVLVFSPSPRRESSCWSSLLVVNPRVRLLSSYSSSLLVIIPHGRLSELVASRKTRDDGRIHCPCLCVLAILIPEWFLQLLRLSSTRNSQEQCCHRPHTDLMSF